MNMGRSVPLIFLIGGLHVVYASEYAEIHPYAACCRSNGAKVGGSGNGFSATPDGCEELCDSTPDCLYFSHSEKWGNCQLCSKCDFTYGGNARYYTSWQKVGEDCQVNSQCDSEREHCINGYCYPHNCFNWMDDALCNAWKTKCFYDGINYGSTT